MLTIPSDVHVTYRLEKRECGQARCKKCHNGDPDAGHGACWYAYWKVSTATGGRKLVPGFAGKTLPSRSPSQRMPPLPLPEHLSLPWLYSRATDKTGFESNAYARAYVRCRAVAGRARALHFAASSYFNSGAYGRSQEFR